MSGWQFTSLASVATIERSSIQPKNIENDTLYVGLEHIISGGDLMPPQRVQKGDLASSKFRFTESHILYGKLRPYLAKIARPDFAGICSTDILPILPSDDLDRRFLLHFLRQPAMVRRANSEAVGANLPRISASTLGGFKVPMPPLAEQRRIANILDKADALRAQRRAALAELDSLTRSIFIDLFGDLVANSMGWPETKSLGDVADIASGITKGRALKGEVTREVAYLAVSNVQDKKLDMRVVKKIEATEGEITRFRLQKDDLLLTEGGDPDKLGRGTLWNGELAECIHQNHVFRVRITDEAVDPLFLNWLVGSLRGKRYFLRSAKQTTGIASINMTQLRAFPLLLPPLELQQELARRISAVEDLKLRHLVALAELDTLFAALQHRAFCGEL